MSKLGLRFIGNSKINTHLSILQVQETIKNKQTNRRECFQSSKKKIVPKTYRMQKQI